MRTDPSLPRPFLAKARLLDFMRQADQSGLINLAAGVPGLDALPDAALRQAFQAALEKDGAAVWAYHHPEGDLALRHQLALRLQSRGVSHVRPEHLITTTGCTQALHILLSLMVQPGTLVACEAPAYYGMLEILSDARARVLPLPCTPSQGGLDLAQTEALLRHHRPACLVLCSTLSNPSGSTLPEEERPPLVELCRSLGVRIIEDDIYGELFDSGAPSPLLRYDPSGEVVSYVTSFSKTVSPGLRCGFAVPGSLHERYAQRKCQQDLHGAVPSEAILREFLAQGAMDPHLLWLRERNRHRRSLALEAIHRTFPQPSRVSDPLGGFMLWVQLPPSLSLAALREAARAEGVVFASGDVFDTDPRPSPCIRLNCAKASESDLLRGISILGRIAHTLV
ncbi:MAG: hypothetical protein RLZZ244_1694 [Verrucomicrobiota bacterium]|jgi:DNA-binding transcriptional MocR family regulator